MFKNDLIIFSLGLIAFAFSHSILANSSVKGILFNRFPSLQKYYRLLYNLIAIISLALLWLIRPSSSVIYKIEFPWSLINVCIMTWALWNAYQSLRSLGSSTFLGIAQVRQNPSEFVLDEKPNATLVTNGWFAIVRHPLYFFSIVILLSLPTMTEMTLIIILSTLIYFTIGIIPEERRLIEMFGKEYEEYKQKTPAIFPNISRFFNK